MKGFLSPLIGLTVFVEDRPGQLARLTALLAEAGLNVKDMELLKVREGRGGTFLLSFENRSAAKKAQSLLRRAKFELPVYKLKSLIKKSIMSFPGLRFCAWIRCGF